MPPEIVALMGSQATVEYESATDMFGDRTYVTRGTYPCYPVATVVKVWSLEGRDDTSTLTLYLATDEIQGTDRVLYKGTYFKIVAIETWVDETDSVWGQVVRLQ